MRRDDYRGPTDTLMRLRAAQLGIARDIEREVWELRARLAPISWGEIGEALGVSKQAARQKFLHVEDTERDDLYDETIA